MNGINDRTAQETPDPGSPEPFTMSECSLPPANWSPVEPVGEHPHGQMHPHQLLNRSPGRLIRSLCSDEDFDHEDTLRAPEWASDDLDDVVPSIEPDADLSPGYSTDADDERSPTPTPSLESPSTTSSASYLPSPSVSSESYVSDELLYDEAHRHTFIPGPHGQPQLLHPETSQPVDAPYPLPTIDDSSSSTSGASSSSPLRHPTPRAAAPRPRVDTPRPPVRAPAPRPPVRTPTPTPRPSLRETDARIQQLQAEWPQYDVPGGYWTTAPHTLFYHYPDGTIAPFPRRGAPPVSEEAGLAPRRDVVAYVLLGLAVAALVRLLLLLVWGVMERGRGTGTNGKLSINALKELLEAGWGD